MAKRRASGDGMVRRRESGHWEGRIVVGHKRNGEPIFRSVYGKTQKELLEKLHREIVAYEGVELTEDSLMTLGAWLDRWLDEYAQNAVRRTTLDNYRGMAERVKRELGDRQISSVTSEDVQRMYRRLREHGRAHPDEEHGAGLSASTVRHIHAMLHLALDAAVRQHIIVWNPTVPATPPKAENREMRVLSERELDAFLAAIRKDEVWHDFFYTEITTGLRRGEICGLRWEDFDEKHGVLHVRRTLHTEDGRLVTGATKTGSGTRDILLADSTAELLQKRRESSYSEWIFPDPTRPERPLSPNAAYNRLKTVLASAGLPDIRFHDLRHTFSTHALKNGVDAKTLSAILGHTNASFTLDTYTHVTGDMQKCAAEIVGGFMEDIFGKELKPWQRDGKMEKGAFASAAGGG